MAAGDDLGARRPGGRSRFGGRPTSGRRRGRRRRSRVAADAGSRSLRPAGAAASAERRSRCTAASSSTSPGCPASSTSTTRRSWSTSAPARSGHRSRTSSGPTYGMTLGHWPQSIDLSTVGGWLACRSAGQFSNSLRQDRGHGRRARRRPRRRTRRSPRAARPAKRSGPTSTRSSSAPRARSASSPGPGSASAPGPEHESPARVGASRRSPTASSSLRRVVRRGATPAVLRLYDDIEADRSYKTGDRSTSCSRVDEGDPVMVDATHARASPRSAKSLGAQPMDDALVEQWMEHRNDVTALEALISRGLRRRHHGGRRAMGRAARASTTRRGRRAAGRRRHARRVRPPVAHATSTAAASTSPSRARSTPTTATAYYTELWDAGTRAVLAAGGALSHHHGVGLNRARFVAEALGPAFDALVALEARARSRTASSTRASSVCRARSARSAGREHRLARRPRRRRRRARAGGARRHRQRSSSSSDDSNDGGVRVLCRDHRRHARRGLRRRLQAPRRSAHARRARRCNRVRDRASAGPADQLAKGSDLRSPTVYVFNLLLMASIGVVGGFIAERRNARVISSRAKRAHRASILVVDVGTSGVRAAIVRPDATVEHVHHREVLPVVAVARASSSSTPSRWPRRARVATSGARRRRTGRRRRHREPTRVDDRVGPRRPASPSGPASDGRTCARSACASCSASKGSASRRTLSATKLAFLLDMADPDRARDLCFGTVDTWIAWTLSDGRSHVTDQQRRRHRAASTATATDGATRRSTCSTSRRRCCPRSSIRRASSARRPRSPARRRSRASPATSRRRSSGRVACVPGWRRSPSAPAACSTCASATSARRSRPAATAARSRSSAGAQAATSRGASRRSCSPPARTSSGCATTSG